MILHLNRFSKISVFEQAFRQLTSTPVDWIHAGKRPWRVDFVGEGSSDAGGPGRESIAAIFQSVMGHPLFVECPGLKGWYVPNPRHQTRNYKRYCFLGSLMGLSLQHGWGVKLPLAKSVFAQIVGRSKSLEHIREEDSAWFTLIDQITSLSSDELADLDAVFCPRQ